MSAKQFRKWVRDEQNRAPDGEVNTDTVAAANALARLEEEQSRRAQEKVRRNPPS